MKTTLTLLLIICFSSIQAQMKFNWRQYSGPISTNIIHPDSASTDVTGLFEVGIYGYELTVSNEFGEDKDSCLVTVIAGGVLSIDTDTLYRIRREEIKKLEIKMIAKATDIYMQIKSPRQQEIECFLCDISGRRLVRAQIKVTKGTNYFTLPKPRMKGVYVLQFSTYYERFSQQIML